MQLELHKFYKIPDRLRKKIIMKYRLTEFDPNDLEQTERKARVLAALRDPEVVPYLHDTSSTDEASSEIETTPEYEFSAQTAAVGSSHNPFTHEKVTEQNVHRWKMLLFDAQGRALFAADVAGECMDRDEHLIFIQHGGSPCAIYDGVRVKFLSAEVNGFPNNVELSFVTSFEHAGSGKTKLTYLVFKKNGASSVRINEYTTCRGSDERDSTPLQTDNSV